MPPPKTPPTPGPPWRWPTRNPPTPNPPPPGKSPPTSSTPSRKPPALSSKWTTTAAPTAFNPATEPHGPLQAPTSSATGHRKRCRRNHHIRAGAPDAITSVRNPLPATGGQDPETLDHARRAIPGAYRQPTPRAHPGRLRRIASTVPGVRNAAAAVGGPATGSRCASPCNLRSAKTPTRCCCSRVHHTLVKARRIGHDLSITAPDYHPVAITLTVQLDPYAIRDTARGQIAELLGSGLLADGKPAFFHPSRFSFGDPLSQRAVAAVQGHPVWYRCSSPNPVAASHMPFNSADADCLTHRDHPLRQ